MFVYSLISYLLFSGALLYLSYVAAENADMIAKYIRTYKYIAWPLVIGAIVWYVGGKLWRMRKPNR
jgi:membrane protein DedA with SNARE-associated domain